VLRAKQKKITDEGKMNKSC